MFLIVPLILYHGMISLYSHQIEAIKKIKNGSILWGGVGSGKSRAALTYYFTEECGGTLRINGRGNFRKMRNPKDLYIITTAKKRDSLEWSQEAAPFLLFSQRDLSVQNVKLTIDSWNNIKKYIDVRNAFFIFDEQRVIGYGAWTKAFLKITKGNNWILLTATPGDTWMDYIPVFIANGFYKHKTDFTRRHVIYNRFVKYPKVERFVEEARLNRLRKDILIYMPYKKSTIPHHENVVVKFDKVKEKKVLRERWNIFEDKPIQNAGELCYILRKTINSDTSRKEAIEKIFKRHKKLIIFYNFNYELDILRNLCEEMEVSFSEWNGQKHEGIPKGKSWIYLIQYLSGAEGWNCTETNAMIFYSLNYSYRIMSQAAGRIDRLNTPFVDLYYYYLRSTSHIDVAIMKALRNKKNFNIRDFSKNFYSRK